MRDKLSKGEVIERFQDSIKDMCGWVYSRGYDAGFSKAKEEYGQHSRGIAHCKRATPEEIGQWGNELWGWCDCGKSIEGRWVGMANFCPWCGRVIEWERNEES